MSGWNVVMRSTIWMVRLDLADAWMSAYLSEALCEGNDASGHNMCKVAVNGREQLYG